MSSMVQEGLLHKILNTPQIEPGCTFGDMEQAWFQFLQTHAKKKKPSEKTGGYWDHLSLSKVKRLLSNSALRKKTTALNEDSQNLYVISPTTITQFKKKKKVIKILKKKKKGLSTWRNTVHPKIILLCLQVWEWHTAFLN